MNDWKEAREVIVGLLKYGTATDQPFTPVGKKALSTALKALDIAEKWTHSAQFRRVELLQADLAQKEKRIGELQEEIAQEDKRIEDGRNYLMSVQPKDLTVENALEAFGFGKNGLQF